MSQFGTKRHSAAAQQFGRFQTEADIEPGKTGPISASLLVSFAARSTSACSQAFNLVRCRLLHSACNVPLAAVRVMMVREPFGAILSL